MLGLSVASAFAMLVSLGAVDAPVEPVHMTTAPAEVAQAYARVVLTIGDQTYKHPGFFAYMGEESLFNFDIGGKVHEVAVGIEGDEKKGYDLVVIYKVGSRLVLDGSGHIEAGKTLEIAKDKIRLSVLVDPHGQVDKKRRKKIDGPGSDDPLG